jgi:hypothetical protein
VSTARKRTRFSITLANACSACSSLNTFTLGRTLVRALKAIVSSESIALPLGHPQRDPELIAEGAGAFQVLVDALLELQRSELIRRDDPEELARFIWAVVHGIAMLAIDGKLKQQQADVEGLVRYSLERARTGISAVP